MIGAAVFVWEEELTNWYYAEIVFNDHKRKSEILPVSTLHTAVQKVYPGKEFTFMEATSEAGKNYYWMSYQASENPGWTWASGVDHYIHVYVNPYTAEIAGEIDLRTDWIMLSRFLHQTLLLKYEIGTEIISVAGLTMIFMALSGLVLWWPKTIRSLKRRLQVKWSSNFKRINWDLHAAGGFYTYLFILFFAGTGLVWSYQWWGNAIYRALGNNPEEVFAFPERPDLDSLNYLDGMDAAFKHAVAQRSDWSTIYFSIPKAGSPKGHVSAGIYYHDADVWWVPSDYYYYNSESGEVYHTLLQNDKLTGEKWRYSNYEMHVGSIYGLPTKIIAFICTLFFAILPVSGFLIWWGRRKKKKETIDKKQPRVATKEIPSSIIRSSVPTIPHETSIE